MVTMAQVGVTQVTVQLVIVVVCIVKTFVICIHLLLAVLGNVTGVIHLLMENMVHVKHMLVVDIIQDVRLIIFI